MKKTVLCLLLALTLLAGALWAAHADSGNSNVIPVIQELDCAKATFDQPYDVYSGPDFSYYRANSGKAQYGGKDCRVYGQVGDWLLMGYKLSNGNFRIGYITADALNHIKSIKGNIKQLNFDTAVIGYADGNCWLTDDPVLNNKSIYTIPKDTAFSVLAIFETEGHRQFPYVEVSTPEGVMRGFVLASHVKYPNGQAPATPLPTARPTARPTPQPTPRPTAIPTTVPYYPTQAPYVLPTRVPTAAPTQVPYWYPTQVPYWYPTQVPYWYPTQAPYVLPTVVPTRAPYVPPTQAPTQVPYWYPTATPVPQAANTYYHDQTKGTWFPETQYVIANGTWPVYAGPGDYYWRNGDGRSTLSTSGCLLYGVENGWAMVGFGLAGGGYRIGFVSANALPRQGLRIPYLDFKYKTGRVTAACSLTDDIVRSYPAVTNLPTGTYVLFLGYINDASANTWAYVEVLLNNNLYRGFIPAANLKLQ